MHLALSLIHISTQDALGFASSVAVGRIEEVESDVQCPIHDDEAVGLVRLRTEVHRAKAQGTDLQPGSSKIAIVHDLHFRPAKTKLQIVKE